MIGAVSRLSGKKDHSRREKIVGVDVSPVALLAGFRSWVTVHCYSTQGGTFLASLPDSVESAVRNWIRGR